ncbi:hypothetical protein LN042_14935 [Kitasatospora sp. RB6PN24]|nr:hypothetical protein [Kitasatospora humi]MCC9308369.1 hypothetical protein [Kitasatospora humi]
MTKYRHNVFADRHLDRLEEITHSVYVNNIPVTSNSVSDAIDLALKANKQLGAMAVTIYKSPSTTDAPPVVHRW